MEGIGISVFKLEEFLNAGTHNYSVIRRFV